MTISLISHNAAAATSATTVNAIGDMILVCAYRSASNTAPTRPGTFSAPTGVGSGANGGGGTNNSFIVGFRRATAVNEGTGTWTNASAVEVIVLRGVHATVDPFGAAEDSGNSTTQTVIYPAANASTIDGTSWHVAFGMKGQLTGSAGVATPPTGWTNRGIVPIGSGTPYMAVHTLEGITGNFAGQTISASAATAVKPMAIVLEITAEPTPPVLSSPAVTSITSSGGTPEVTSDQTTGVVACVVVADGATAPSAAQILAGQDSTGGPALYSDDIGAVAGVNTLLAITGLSPSTPYDAYFVQDNGVVTSNVVKADFTTSAGATQVEMTGGVSGSGASAGTANARIAVSGSISSTGSASGAVATRIAIVGNTSSSGSAQGAIAALIAIAGAVSSAGSSTGSLSTVVSITGQVNGSGVLTGIVVRLQPLQGQSSGAGLTAATLYKLISLIGSVTGLGVAVAAFEEEGDFISGAVIGVGSAAAALSTVQPLSGESQGAASLDAEIERILGLAGSAEGSGLTAADLSAVLTLLGHVFAVSEVTGDLSNISGIVIEIPPCPSIVEVDPSQNVVMLDPSTNAIDILQSVTNVDLICLTSEEEEALANG